MSVTPDGGSPFDYDLGLERVGQLPHYDPEAILERAVWPTVNHLWRCDWREDARLGQNLAFPATGAFNNTLFDISLEVSCYGMRREDLDCSLLGHALTLAIKEDAPEEMRELIFHHASEVSPELTEALEDYGGLVVKKGVIYSFDTEEEAEITAFQSIDDTEGDELWVSDRLDEHVIEDMDDEEEAADVLFRFHLHDIENIAMALSILGASERCLRELDIIKTQ